MLDKLLTAKEQPGLKEWLPATTGRINWSYAHIQYLIPYLEKVRTGEIKRLMINLPPRHTKSELATIHFPAWILEQEPTWRIIVGCYAASLAKTFSRKTRAIIENNGVVPLDPNHQAADDWATILGGGLKAVGRGGGITGHGAELFIIDDPVKSSVEADSDARNNEAWSWYGDVVTRLEPGAAIIYMGTRWREDDLAGRILASEDGPNWVVVSLPGIAEKDDPLGREPGEALCPERYTAEDLFKLLPVLGSRGWYAEIQQKTVQGDGALFNVSKIKYLDEMPKLVRSVCAWDTAGTPGGGDWSVGAYCGFDADDRFIVGNLRRFQKDALGVDAEVLEMAEILGEGVIHKFQQAPADAGKEQAERKVRLVMAHGFRAISSVMTGEKSIRADGLSACVNAGNMYLVRGTWTSALINEMREAPTGKRDDQWDALADGYNYLTGGKRAQVKRLLDSYDARHKQNVISQLIRQRQQAEVIAAAVNVPIEQIQAQIEEKKKEGSIYANRPEFTDPTRYRPR